MRWSLSGRFFILWVLIGLMDQKDGPEKIIACFLPMMIHGKKLSKQVSMLQKSLDVESFSILNEGM